MSTTHALTIELDSDAYRQLREHARRKNIPPEVLAAQCVTVHVACMDGADYLQMLMVEGEAH